METGKILIVDDDQNICELLRLYAEKEGYTVALAHDGRKAVECFEQESPDIILLDIMLPELDGWQVCREIRKKSQCPIIMLTAKGETFDKVLGLELGADDYVVKPFSLRHLYAKSLALLKRARKSDDGEELRCGNISLNKKTMMVKVKGIPIEIKSKEYFLLLYLLENKDAVLTRKTILEHVWCDDLDVSDRIVDSTIKRLRDCLGEAAGQIRTVIGRGYRISEE